MQAAFIISNIQMEFHLLRFELQIVLHFFVSSSCKKFYFV